MKRLKILCAVLLIVFFGNMYQGAVLPFIEGIRYGITIAKYQEENKQETDDFILMDVVSKDANYMEKSETNLLTGKGVLTRTNNLTIIIDSIANKPNWWTSLQIVSYLITITILLLGGWIPFILVRIIKSLQHSEVFDRINLKRINRIGIFLLVLGFLSSIFQAINISLAKGLVELSNYNLSYAKVIDFNPIIMGVVILIMNEILKMAIEIKEEQDLTI